MIMANINDKEASELLKRAKQAQERRRKITDISVGGNIVLPLRETVKTYAPECIGKNGKDAEFHEYFGRPEDIDKLVNKGYEPVIHEGQHVQHDELVLFRIPMDIWKRQQNDKKAKSDRMLVEAKATSPEVKEANSEAKKAGESMASEEFRLIKPANPKPGAGG